MTTLSIAEPESKTARTSRPSRSARLQADRRESEMLGEQEALETMTAMILLAALLGASDPWGPDAA